MHRLLAVCGREAGPTRGTSAGSVIVLSGSGGGIPEGYARKLCDYRLTAFALAYFGVAGLPESLEEIPVETIERGVGWFRSQLANTSGVGLMGTSKGAELALLAASLLPERVRLQRRGGSVERRLVRARSHRTTLQLDLAKTTGAVPPPTASHATNPERSGRPHRRLLRPVALRAGRTRRRSNRSREDPFADPLALGVR